MNCKFWWFLLPQDIIREFTQEDGSRIADFEAFNELVADITWWTLPQKLQLMADFVEYDHTFTWFRLPEQVEDFCEFVSGLTSVTTTLFYVATDDGCPPTPTISTPAYHDGAGALPVPGDNVYTDEEATTFLADGFYVQATTSGGNVSAQFGQVSSGVYATATANCE